jgi:lipid-A-disaccharide synthase
MAKSINRDRPHILVLTGEASGDLHASNLVKALLSLENPPRVSAFGGPLLRKAGARLVKDMRAYSVVGISEVLKMLPNFLSLKKYVETWVVKEQPAFVILIDYPGFHLKLLPFLAKRVPVIWYIPPKVWVWKEKRAELLEKYCSKVFSIFPFETKYYPKKGAFLGHPLADCIKEPMERDVFLEEKGLSPEKRYIGLIPGSRVQEIKSLLPIYLEAAVKLASKHRGVEFILPRAGNLDKKLINRYVSRYKNIKIHVISDRIHDVMNACELLICTSGTVTLEAGFLKRPMIICNKGSFITWLAFKTLSKSEFLGLPNILAGKEICPELLQKDANPEKLYEVAGNILTSASLKSKQVEELEKHVSPLFEKGVSQRIAEAIESEFMQ